MALGDKKPVVMEEDRGIPGGVATLDENGKLVQMPTAADVGAVNRAGDTMTGNLNITGTGDVKTTITNTTSGKTLNLICNNNGHTILNNTDNSTISEQIHFGNGEKRLWYNWYITADNKWDTNEILHTGNYSDHALPRDGSQPMTGTLNILGHSLFSAYEYDGKDYVEVQARSDARGNQKSWIQVNSGNDIAKGLTFLHTDSQGNSVDYDVFHTGNKPSGSYTGNGDATTRVIDTGGIGSCLMIHGNNYSTLVTSQGGLVFSNDGATIKVLPHTAINYYNGVLSIATADAAVNGANAVHNYQGL